MSETYKKKIEIYNEAFIEAKKTLNEKQAIAVDQVYGPVMTVAGPGTGKTQLLAVRIGNILQQTDVGINNILSLTFTDAGSIAMRSRLKKFIGPEAYNANIFTFHAFCSFVIQENIEYFGGFRNLQIVSDLELVDVYREIIDGFSMDNPLKRFKGDIYFEKKRLQNLFNTMKQEGWEYSMLEQMVDGLWDYYHLKDERGEWVNPEFVCKRKQIGKKTKKEYLKNEVNGDKVQDVIDKFDKLLAGAQALETYKDILARMERYDYNDMIQFVIDAFKSNEELLAKYQERFQFILVDEYQDTNGTQNELIFLLADNPIDDKPNVFIVGDDDQSIYRFQGANMNNILDFANKYNPTEVVLDNNYRSYQGILDRAKMLIEHNGQRLVNERAHLTKHLIESRHNPRNITVEPKIYRYKNIAQEEVGILNEIIAKHKDGVPLNEIAIIYRKHKNVENIVKYLTLKGIPLNLKKKINVLKQKEVRQLITIMAYVDAEFKRPMSGESIIFEMMHYEYFGVSASDIAKISIFCSKKGDNTIEEERRWRFVIAEKEILEKAGVKNIQKVLDFSALIESWIQDIANCTSQVFFEKVLTKGKILDHILAKEDKVWRLQLVNTLFNFIKDEASKEENISIVEIIDRIQKMEDNRIDMPLNKIIYSEQGVNFLTAHGSKGLEFDHVYIMYASNKNWVEKNYGGNNSFKFPLNLVPATDKSDVEDDRRLFYVAMTRAKNNLTVSYADFDDAEKPLEQARFIAEIIHSENEIEEKSISEEDVLEYKATLLRYSQGEAKLIEKDLIDNIIQTFRMSATSLNKYLRCPLAFYFENILRVPMARKASNGFGNAVHYALEMYFIDLEAQAERKLLPEEILIKYFEKGMKKFHSHFTETEQKLSLVRGRKLFAAYYKQYSHHWTAPRKNELEVDIKTEFSGVPISGKLDRVAVYDDHLQVIDYKTGKYDSKKLKPPVGDEDPGGDYWRQIVFYKMLLRGNSRLTQPMRQGIMDFVEITKEDTFKRKEYEVEEFEIEIVGAQLKTAYQGILDHKFENGCGDEKCTWCNFVNENMPLTMLVEQD